EVSRLFKPFEQGDASHTRRFGGTGLGLAISLKLAKRLGGSLSVTSSAGEGSKFSLTLPTGDLQGVRLITSPSEALEEERHSRAEMSRSVTLSGRVLLVEDGPDNQRLIAFHLRRAGAEVVIAGNGAEAITAVTEAEREGLPFGVILMDMQMPV